MAKIVFNGREYASFEELPPEAREALKQAAAALGDKNKDGIPDVMQGAAAPGEIQIKRTVVNQSFNVAGEVSSPVQKLSDADRGLSLQVNLSGAGLKTLAIGAAIGAALIYFLFK